MRSKRHPGFKAVIFDLDGTLTDTRSVWRHLHKKFSTWDVGEKTADLYENGKITYEEWARLDASCWKNIPLAQVLSALGEIRYTTGAPELMEQLRTHGIRTGIVSAGLSVLVDKAKIDLGVDLAISNELRVNEGTLTGEVLVRVGTSNKPEVIEEAAWLLGAEMGETVAVGDNASDIPRRAGLRIAFKPLTLDARSIADIVIDDDDIRAVADHILQ
jgi:phosphoserine phosphatase